jgi:hypothetical protein
LQRKFILFLSLRFGIVKKMQNEAKTCENFVICFAKRSENHAKRFVFRFHSHPTPEVQGDATPTPAPTAIVPRFLKKQILTH